MNISIQKVKNGYVVTNSRGEYIVHLQTYAQTTHVFIDLKSALKYVASVMA